MRTPWRKHPGIAISSVIIIVLLIWGFWPRAVLVDMATTKKATFTMTIEEEGRTRVVDRYVVSAPVDGVACRIDLNVGDAINQGEMLVNITPLQSQVLDPSSQAQARARVEAAQSALHSAEEKAAAAKAAAELAVKEEERLRKLAEQGLIPKDVHDKAQTEVITTRAAQRSALFTVDVARHELQAAQSVLDYAGTRHGADATVGVPVTAPITGQVLKVEHECEGVVRTGQALLEVGDTSILEVIVDVLSDDAVRIKPGMRVFFDRWGGEQSLEGVVRTIEPVGFTKISALGVEEQRVWIVADFISPKEQWQSLGDGYRVEARFVIWQEDNVLQIPASALFRHNDGWAVFAVKQDKALIQPVEVGKRNGLAAQILNGLQEGDTVIVHPGDDIAEGIKVIAR
ncbi:MAG: secretion protein HlyD [Gammaproteobacteria bacterium SG8_15]|nr:MAG: secretion protein HlyD [Gammaproteobacteria bacterium SG8_15]